MSSFNRSLSLLVLLLLMAGRLNAAAIEERLFQSSEAEARYDHLIDIMRCPMCLNSNLAGSNAPIAEDLREEIFNQIQSGRSDKEIIAFMRERYGDFIMYSPPLNIVTSLLWFGPGVLLLLGFFIIRKMLASRAMAAANIELSPEERQKLAAFMTDKGEKG